MLHYIPSKAVLSRLIDILRDNQAAQNIEGGICEIVDLYDGRQGYLSFYKDRSSRPSIFADWKYYTGDHTFPVPIRGDYQVYDKVDVVYNIVYGNGDYMLLWQGEQLELRRSLIMHLLKVWHEEFNLSSQFKELRFNINKLKFI